MRTIDQAFDYVLEQDSETSLTKTALRRLVTTGKLPSVRVGQKYLVSLETLEEYMNGNIPDTSPAAIAVNGIRRIDV